jgi:excisionase family DNA binding protein
MTASGQNTATIGHTGGPPLEPSYSVQEAAALLGISDKTLYRMAQHGQLPCQRYRRRVLIPRAVVAALLAPPTGADMQQIERIRHGGKVA